MNLFSNAKWIGTGEKLDRKCQVEKSPSVRLRRSITLDSFEKAVCRILGLGLFVLHINGKRVSDEVLSPAFTNYDKRALYLEYDVSSYLRQGENVIAVEPGDGFFNQTCHYR